MATDSKELRDRWHRLMAESVSGETLKGDVAWKATHDFAMVSKDWVRPLRIVRFDA